MTGPGRRAFETELARWAAAGWPATFWLRDDDAVAATDALDRLLEVAARAGVPLALAVIPQGATAGLARRLGRASAVSVLQHGYAHANHAAAGAKKAEFSDDRPLERMTGELVRGRAAIVRLFGESAEPVLAPPWNRIAEALAPRLAACGLSGLSRFTPRRSPEAAPGVVEANAHVDLIDWRGGRRGKPEDAVWAEIAAHLAARRAGTADPEEPTGLLAHHLAMDGTAWGALAAVLDRLGRASEAAWPGARDIFRAGAVA